MISLRHVTKIYGRRTVLDDLSFELPEREAVVITGPSGSGKSTLLRIIAGLEAPDDGEIFIDGSLASSPGYLLPPYRRSLGMVFQSPSLWPHMKVREIVAYGIHGVTAPERDARVHELVTKAHIESLVGSYPHQLSGGEARRVAILRAIAPRPRVLLMDEPMVHLDLALKAELLQLVADFVRECRPSLVYVTHDVAEGRIFTGRHLVLRGGAIIHDGEEM